MRDNALYEVTRHQSISSAPAVVEQLEEDIGLVLEHCLIDIERISLQNTLGKGKPLSVAERIWIFITKYQEIIVCFFAVKHQAIPPTLSKFLYWHWDSYTIVSVQMKQPSIIK